METPSVKDILDQQRQLRRSRQRRKLKRWIVVVLINTGLILALLGIAFFPQSHTRITFVRDRVISVDELRSLIDAPLYPHHLLTFAPENFVALNSHPLIKEVVVKPYRFGFWEVYVREFLVLGVWHNDSMALLENGTRTTLTSPQRARVQDAPLIFGYDDALHLSTLAQALAQLEPAQRVFMAEIAQEPRSYDASYARIRMVDGVQIESSLSTLNVLNDYTQIKRALNPLHNCIVIDEITRVPYSFSCTP
jgi:cell division septal protein FtsQ